MKISEAKAWMTCFFCQIGDCMPHIQQIHLPHFLTKHDVCMRMKKELTEQGMDVMESVSLLWFYKVWDKDFRNFVIPEVKKFILCERSIWLDNRHCVNTRTNANVLWWSNR